MAPRLTDRLPVGVANVDIKGSVSGVRQGLAPGAVVLVAFLHRAQVPVSPVHRVLKHGQGKRVRQSAVIHRVSVVALQV